MGARNRELWNLIVVGLLMSAGFASVYIARQEQVSSASLTAAGFFFALYFVAHMVARYTVPYADPYLLPLGGLLTAIGLTEIYRLHTDDAFRQGTWVVVGVALFSLTLIALRRDYRQLESYKYLFGIASILLLLLPALPHFGATVNGARLWVRVGSLQFQPGELAKIFLIVFLAGYLREKREVLAQGRIKDYGPLLAIWGAAMLILVETHDLGSALLFFGIFLAMVYVATGRAVVVLIGLVLFVGGAAFVYHYDRPRAGARPGLARSLKYAHGPGLPDACRASTRSRTAPSAERASARARSRPRTGQQIIPYANTDFIYAALAQELGLIGVAALVLVYMLVVLRGMRVALLADDGFSKLLAAGLTFGFALQTFIIVGGVVRIIPLTGITMPVRLLRRVEPALELRAPRRADARLQPAKPPMNHQITRLGVVAVVLLASLIVMTTYWQAWAATDLADRQDNALETVAAAHRQAREDLCGQDGGRDEREAPGRRPDALLPPLPSGRALLAGRRLLDAGAVACRARTVRERLPHRREHEPVDRPGHDADKLQGKTVTGNNVHLTLRPGAQRVAYQQLGSRCGAVVAIEPSTGRVLVMASTPTYNPNLIEKDYNKVANQRTGCGGKLVNRATAGLYAPGSTFKVVTTTAALNSGKFKPTSTFDDPGYCEEYGKRVYNAETNSPFGTVTLAEGLQHSINSVYCNVGKALGAIKLLDTAREFGFYDKPPLDLPSGEVKASGLYKNDKLFFPKNDFQVDPGRLAFGQERLGVTPLQMAMVAATVANKGVLMKPQLVERITSPSGKTVVKRHPDALNRAMTPAVAEEINQMMQSVVAAGTGTNAQIPGVKVAGKTGTAETGVAGRNTTWFISFAPADDPKVAVAVVVENQPGVGNTYAAPIAKAVLQALLPKASNSHP